MRLIKYRGQWYATRWEDGKRQRISLRTKDRRLAEQRLADLQASPDGTTVADIYRLYMDDLTARGKGAARAIDAWKALNQTFGNLRPDQVNRARCRAYVASRREDGRKDGTIAKELSCLRAALRWYDKNTPAVVELPARSAPRERWLTREEYARLRKAAKITPHLYVFVVLALATAGRKQAILDLTWDRVDFARNQIRLYAGGSGKGRATVPMTRHARRTLMLAKRASITPYVIEYDGRKVGSIKRSFAAACARAGLDDVTPHDLRRTAGRWMAEAGISMDEIAQFMGHSDSRVTQRVYARFSPEYLRRAASALE